MLEVGLSPPWRDSSIGPGQTCRADVNNSYLKTRQLLDLLWQKQNQTSKTTRLMLEAHRSNDASDQGVGACSKEPLSGGCGVASFLSRSFSFSSRGLVCSSFSRLS